MTDVSVVAALITTAGTLGGALGGIALTSWTGIRREEREAGRQRENARAAAREQVYADLLGASAQLRAHIEITCQRHWKDLNVRLTATQDYAVAVGLQASRAALLSAKPSADAALALSRAASKLSAWVAVNAHMGDYSGPGEQFVPGEVLGTPDFTEFDRYATEFLRLATIALGYDVTPAGTPMSASSVALEVTKAGTRPAGGNPD
jgi:hypothetical protein